MLAELRQYVDCWEDRFILRQTEVLLTTHGWEYLDEGRHRKVWRRGNYVIKVPTCWEGLSDNSYERQLWSKYRQKGEIPYASCRMIHNTFLLMEYVEHIDSYIALPSWADSVDCQQVGRNRRGKIVAYDYAE